MFTFLTPARSERSLLAERVFSLTPQLEYRAIRTARKGHALTCLKPASHCESPHAARRTPHAARRTPHAARRILRAFVPPAPHSQSEH